MEEVFGRHRAEIRSIAGVYGAAYEDDADRFAHEHANCDAAWTCRGCERDVCPRCEPSPGEQDLCAECWWTEDPDGRAA